MVPDPIPPLRLAAEHFESARRGEEVLGRSTRLKTKNHEAERTSSRYSQIAMRTSIGRPHCKPRLQTVAGPFWLTRLPWRLNRLREITEFASKALSSAHCKDFLLFVAYVVWHNLNG
jgi:hypothetical protein